MRRIILSLLLCLACFTQMLAQERRPIDSRHPLWLVHVDVWNKADPQKIINLIPADIRPYVCMNLSLSCQYDTEKNVYKMPQNAVRTYKSWASVCQANGMWFTCQPASGGHTHIQDNDLETFEYFFRQYPNFLGWNYAEQFWGFDEPGDRSSSSQTSRIALFAKLVEMSHKYGGFLTISFCGNQWSHPLNPVGMMKRNSDLMAACKKYPEAILWLYKYTTSGCFYNNESVTFGPFVAGLAKNYGVRYDNCGYNGALDIVLGEKHGKKYPVAAGIGTVMEQTCQNGGAVWDGPELIWTEDFQNLYDSTTDNGYTQRNWGTFPGFDNAWIDMFRHIISGQMYIPSREEVVNKTKFIIINNVTNGSDEDKYATWGDLYNGLYKQTDPFNPNGGQIDNNHCYFKSTGRYGAIPMTPELGDDLSKTIPNKVYKSSRNTFFSSQTMKEQLFKAAYPAVSTGDLFVSRHKNQLITYTPYTYVNKKTTAKANIPLQYNTCQELQLTYGKLSSGVIREYADHIDFYLNNYRSDTTKNVTDVITVTGASAQPTYTFTKRQKATATVTEAWDAETSTFTLNVSHNGPVDIQIACAGTATDRSTDMVTDGALDIPKQPEAFNGELIIECEDMNYKSVSKCCVDPYNQYPNIRGHAGNGFIDMGTNTAAAIQAKFDVKQAGKYNISLRYSTTGNKGGNMRITRGANILQYKCDKTNINEWRKATVAVSLVEGSNTVTITNTGGVRLLADQIIIAPADKETEKFLINVRDTENGTISVSDSEAAEGTTVTLTPNLKANFSVIGWNIIHGDVNITENADGTYSFVMPDDNVTLEPICKDLSEVYSADIASYLAGTLPKGWRCTDGTTVHQYPSSYGSGPRIMGGFPGKYPKGIYWRVTSADFGKQTAYPLTLAPGKYSLNYVVAAWNNAPKYTAQILRKDGTILAQGTQMTATPNAAGKTATDLSSAVKQTLEFTVTKEDNYVINFKADGSAFPEYLILSCTINTAETTGVDNVIADIVEEAGQYEIYNAEGMRLPSIQRGLNIICVKGQTVKKIWIK